MKAFYQALFEISNEIRHDILLRLADEPMNLTQLSKSLGLSFTETSRHLSRIGEIELTRRDTDGLYHINPYGRVLLSQLKGAEFVSTHRDYFNTHTIKHLPPEFVCRLSELEKCEYVNDVMVVLENIRTGMKEAEEFIWPLLEQYPLSTVPLVKEAHKRGVKLKVLEPIEWIAPLEFYDTRAKNMTEWGTQAMRMGLLEFRVLKRIDVFLYMTEKEVSALAFPTLDGKFDYLGFKSTDNQAHQWCKDLFNYYWNKAHSLQDPLRIMPARAPV